jgi:hypothetical protein
LGLSTHVCDIIHDKELLAIIRALCKWKVYLKEMVKPVTVYTDHKSLEYFMTTKELNRRQARWALKLAEYNFVIKYRKGSSNNRADALSRRLGDKPLKGGETHETVLKPEHFTELAVITSKSDFELVEILHILQHEDKGLSVIRQALQNKDVPKALKKSISEYHIDDDGIIMFRGRMVMPDNADLKKEIVQSHHDSGTAGHPGREKTLDLVTRDYWWTSVTQYIHKYVDGCEQCQHSKTVHTPSKVPLKPLRVPKGPWQDITYDLITGLPQSKGFDSILNVVDHFTKMAHFIPCKEKITALGVAELFLQNVWKLHGFPAQTVSDRGPQFNAAFLRNLYKFLGIQPHFSTAYHPQTDGQTEQVNQNIGQYLRLYATQCQDNWAELLPLAEFTYNNSKHSVTVVPNCTL